MSKIQIDGTALSLAVLAAAFGFSLLPGPFTWIASIAGLVLAIVLLSFDGEGQRSLFASLAFSAAVGLCLTLASAVLYRLAMTPAQGPLPGFEGRLANEFLPLTWVALTVFLWVVDRSRMGARVPLALPQAGQPSFSFVPRNAPVAPAPVWTAPVSTAPVASPPLEAAPMAPPPLRPEAPRATPTPVTVHSTFTQPSFGTAGSAPAETYPVAVTPPPAPVQAFAPPPAPEPPPLPPPPPIAPLPTAPVSMPSGKEATVYVTLVGEGLNVLRAVRAEHLGRDFYKIVEDMPAGETWQFGPGQVVRAKKRNLSSGKAMVAVEEAPRAS